MRIKSTQITTLLFFFLAFTQTSNAINYYSCDTIIPNERNQAALDKLLGVPSAIVTDDSTSTPENAIQGDAIQPDNEGFFKRRDPFRLGDFLGDYDYISISSLGLWFIALVGGLVLSIIGIPGFIFAFPLYLIAGLLAYWGLRRHKRHKLKGQGFAIATLALLIGQFLLGVFLILLVIIILLNG
jgi:hypothetical protein